MQLKDDSIFSTEEKSDKSIAESTFNTSDTLPTNNEHFSSCERLNSTFKSILDDNITSQSNSSVCNVEKLDNLKNNLTNGSIMSSISSIINDIECIENITFPTKHLLTNSEVYKFDEKEIIAKNNSSLPKINCSNINEYTPDLSMLSSYLGSDDYFTCPDSNPEKYILNTNKTEIQIEDVINNVSMTGFNDSKRYYFVLTFNIIIIILIKVTFLKVKKMLEIEVFTVLVAVTGAWLGQLILNVIQIL